MTESSTDGRRVKGEQRRRELIDATLRVVGREGVSGVSHRTVAREAGLPATAAAYYFQSIDALLTAALIQSMDEDTERMRQLVVGGGADGIRGLAVQMAEVLNDPARLLAEYELYLMAARDHELRQSTSRWMDAVAEFASKYTSDPARIQVLVGLVDGLLLQALLTDDPPNADEFEALLRAALREPHVAPNSRE